MPPVLRAQILSDFTCLGDRCEDTCCKGWSMQVDAPTRTRYLAEAPELLDATERVDSGWIMRKDAASQCVKLEGGLCGIHKSYGERLLGDACYFYPRIPRTLGGWPVMGAALSCPEIARLALSVERPGALREVALERLPDIPKDYLLDGLPLAQALFIHQAFIAVAEDETLAPEQAYLRIARASRYLDGMEPSEWPSAPADYLPHAEAELPPAQMRNEDPFNLLHALCGISVATRKPPTPRLLAVFEDIEQALGATLDWGQVTIHTMPDSLARYHAVRARWRRDEAVWHAPLLSRWLQMQLSQACFPFGGLGGSPAERITLIGVRLATLRLALICAEAPDGPDARQARMVRVMQTLSRLLDHLADPAFSLQIYTETGWMDESRMRGLLEG